MPKSIRYGSRGQTWHPNFIKYIRFIVEHPVYKGMPDAIDEDDKIQWEAPSNRKSGRYKDTHHKRRDWWRKKARKIGIRVGSSQWISRTAKSIHPTKEKPCKRCGRVMKIRYVYPKEILFRRLRKQPYFRDDFKLSNLEPITDLIKRLHTTFGDQVIQSLPKMLQTSHIQPSAHSTLSPWLRWLERTYIPQESALLSPGAMSNAPDRFDGFHSFNLCCRGKADTGRHKTNLQSYTTDRRVFEYWADGDWVAADRLMGQIRSKLQNEACRNGHDGPCAADHIGPISLGFCHRPEFQLLCGPCNSAKNNRMQLWDVEHLRKTEEIGETVISWHSKALWDLRKNSINNDETALRHSKQLRDNRHSLMAILQKIASAGHYTFLVILLNLEYADHSIEFVNLRVENHVTVFDQIVRTSRTTKYAAEQKARRCRIAFDSLHSYFEKESRNALVISNSAIEAEVRKALAGLQRAPVAIRSFNDKIKAVLTKGKKDKLDSSLRSILSSLPASSPEKFQEAKLHIIRAMELIALELSQRWDDERYVRAERENFDAVPVAFPETPEQ